MPRLWAAFGQSSHANILIFGSLPTCLFTVPFSESDVEYVACNMKAGVLSCVSVGVAAIVAICGLNFKRQPHVTTTPFSLLVSPDLFIQTDYFQPEKWLPRIPVSTFLIRSGTDYLLVDAGNPGLPFTDDLLAAISDATKDGQLRLVLREFNFPATCCSEATFHAHYAGIMC